MSKYAVFTNKTRNKKLVYYPCPKNANTSAKMFFAKHLNVDKHFLFLYFCPCKFFSRRFYKLFL